MENRAADAMVPNAKSNNGRVWGALALSCMLAYCCLLWLPGTAFDRAAHESYLCYKFGFAFLGMALLFTAVSSWIQGRMGFFIAEVILGTVVLLKVLLVA